MRVVIDANLIIERDWHLRSSAGQALLAGARTGRVQLVIPEVLVRETVTVHAERLATEHTKLRSALARVRRLDGPRRADDASSGEPRPATKPDYETWLRQDLAANGVEMVAIPEVSADLVARALDRRRPFDADGRVGFRDALIWHSVVDGASADETTVFATDNTRDFADSKAGGLHQHLLADLAARNLDENAVRLVRSLEDAARIALAPSRAVLTRLRQRFALDPEWTEVVVHDMDRAVTDAAVITVWEGLDIALEPGGVKLEDYATGADLDDIDIVGAPTAEDAFPLTDEIYGVELSAAAEATFQVQVSERRFAHGRGVIPPGVDISPSGIAYFEGHATVRVVFDARYAPGSEELTSISAKRLVGA